MALIKVSDYVKRIVHIIFQMQPKEGGRTVDGLWETIGAGEDTAREEIVNGAGVMHPLGAQDQYLSAHGRDRGRMVRGIAETDEEFRIRVATPWTFWQSAGTKAMLIAQALRVGCSVDINPHPSKPYRRLVTILTLPLDGLRLFLDMFRFKPSHVIFEYELGPGLEYAGVDYEYDQTGTGVDSRPQLDRIIET